MQAIEGKGNSSPLNTYFIDATQVHGAFQQMDSYLPVGKSVFDNDLPELTPLLIIAWIISQSVFFILY